MPGIVPFTGNIAENKNTWFLPLVNLYSGLSKGMRQETYKLNIKLVRWWGVLGKAEKEGQCGGQGYNFLIWWSGKTLQLRWHESRDLREKSQPVSPNRGKGIPGRGNLMCQGPEVKACLECCNNGTSDYEGNTCQMTEKRNGTPGFFKLILQCCWARHMWKPL